MKREFSAGGVVFRQSPVIASKAKQPQRSPRPAKTEFAMTNIEILVCQHSGHHGWVFPKGFIGDKIAGETKEATALREVEEETGVVGEILEPLNPITYWYIMDNEKHQKTVYYYIMKEIGGDITKHDWEMENVEWLPMTEVKNRLTYDSDKTVWAEARQLIAKNIGHRAKTISY